MRPERASGYRPCVIVVNAYHAATRATSKLMCRRQDSQSDAIECGALALGHAHDCHDFPFMSSLHAGVGCLCMCSARVLHSILHDCSCMEQGVHTIVRSPALVTWKVLFYSSVIHVPTTTCCMSIIIIRLHNQTLATCV
jgi:hypothetical protein